MSTARRFDGGFCLAYTRSTSRPSHAELGRFTKVSIKASWYGQRVRLRHEFVVVLDAVAVASWPLIALSCDSFTSGDEQKSVMQALTPLCIALHLHNF